MFNSCKEQEESRRWNRIRNVNVHPDYARRKSKGKRTCFAAYCEGYFPLDLGNDIALPELNAPFDPSRWVGKVDVLARTSLEIRQRPTFQALIYSAGATSTEVGHRKISSFFGISGRKTGKSFSSLKSRQLRAPVERPAAGDRLWSGARPHRLLGKPPPCGASLPGTFCSKSFHQRFISFFFLLRYRGISAPAS